MTKRTKPLTQQKLFIEALERPAVADSGLGATTLAVGEECTKGK
jgi:hypothetical protein